MTQELLEQLVKTYNTLLLVSTKGEDTMIMGQCLTSMRNILMEIQQNINTNNDTAENNSADIVE